jgi:hypothetical protein
MNGTWNLQDNLTCSLISLENGTFKSNNHNITVNYSFFTCNSYATPPTNRALFLGSSIVTLSNDFYATSTNFNFDAGTSTIIIKDAFNGTLDITCFPNGLHFYTSLDNMFQNLFRSMAAVRSIN